MEPKKNPRKDVYKLQSIWFNAGLFISLCTVIMAFEWRSYDEIVVIDPEYTSDGEIYETPVTIIPPPPRPKPAIANLIEKPDDEPIEVPEIEVITDIDILGDVEPPELPKIKDEDAPTKHYEPWELEKQPEPKGGMDEFYTFVKKNIKYPRQARNLDIEGKVYAQFIVDEEGNISSVEILRGIGAGCDEEVIRLLEMAPQWNPGKQRGRPVKVKIVVPIHFSLK